jgi:hypothetical protein
MSKRPERPHVSAALSHLRHGVTFAALVVCVCALTQMMVFGFVHFTQVRYDKTERPPTAQALSVVPSRAGMPAGTHQPSQAAADPQYSDINPRHLSGWDPSLHVISDMAVSVGVIATVMLATLCLLGISVAGGGSVPGVDRVVSSGSWALVLALACIPWRDVLVSMPFPGVFSSYEGMTSLSDLVDAGEASLLRLLAIHLLMPLAAVAVSLLALARFRTGVAEGIIVTSVSELDERLERELSQIRSRGVAANTPRAVAALNEAIGEKPVAPEMPIEPDPSRRPARGRPFKVSRQAEDSGEEEYKRPI